VSIDEYEAVYEICNGKFLRATHGVFARSSSSQPESCERVGDVGLLKSMSVLGAAAAAVAAGVATKKSSGT
jgi:hypothetical protein